MDEIVKNDYFPPPKSGFSGSYKGSVYQIRLLQYYALLAFNYGLMFKLWTEDEDLACKFDDLVMTCKVNGKCKLFCVQAKHKETPSTVDFTDKNFHLSKYFFSTMKTLQNLGGDLDAIESLVLCTNNTFPSPDSDGISFVTFYNQQLHFEKISCTGPFNVEGEIYKLKFLENYQVLKLYLLAEELIKFLFKKNSDKNSDQSDEFYLLPHAKDFLSQNILEVTEFSIKFKTRFINSTDSDIEVFRNIFMQEATSNKIIRYDRNSPKDFWNKIKLPKANMNDLIATFSSFKNNGKEIENCILNFTEKLLFKSNFGQNEVEQAIKIEILKNINDLSQSEVSFTKLHDKFCKWLESNLHKKLNNSDIREFFQNFDENNIFKTSPLKFSSFPKDLEDFLKSPNDRIFIYEVANGQTFFGSMKLYQLNNKIIYQSTATNLKFDKILAITKFATSEICLVVECDEKVEVNVLSEFLRKFLEESKVKLMLVCESDLSGKLLGFQKFREDEMLCGQLAKDSLDRYLMKTVNFQGNPISLNELLDTESLEEFSLKVFLDSIEKYASGRSLRDPEPPVYYLSRKIRRQVFLKESILYDWNSNKFEDFLVFSETDFFTQLPEAQKLGKAVHWVEKNKDQKKTKVIWRKSYFSIELIRSYIDVDDYTATTDEEFLSNIQQYNIFRDIPGMGKSVFFQHLLQQLQAKHKNHWVQKIDVRSYCQEFEEFQEQSIKKEGIINYFSDQFLKFQSNSLEKVIFSNLLSKGRVILLWDGFDELAEEHRDILLTIISAFSETSKENKFFMSSRPECANILEDKYFELPYYFEEFSLENQLDYLLKAWKKDSTFKEKAKLILQRVNKTITVRERSYTGIPLITKHVATYFEDKLDSEVKLENLKLTTYNLIKHDVNKKMEIFLIEKQGRNMSEKFYKRQLKELHKKHQNLAQIFFPECKTYFGSSKKFEPDEVEEFVGCGLFQNVNGILTPYHQTVAESLFTAKLEDNLEDIKVLKFLFEVVLKKKSYQLIQSFVNNFIEKILGSGNQLTLKSLIQENIEVLNVAAKEGNSNTFEVLFQIVTENMEDSFITLLKGNENCHTLFYNFFLNCDASETFLDGFGNTFDLEFIKEMLQLVNSENELTIMIAAARHGRNYLPLSKWIIRTFSNDFPFIEKIISTKDWTCNKHILHYSCENFHKESFISFLGVLKRLSDKFEVDFLSRLMVHVNDSNETFFYNLVYYRAGQNTDFKDDSFEVLTEILDWIKENTNVFEEIVFMDPIIRLVAWRLKKCTLKLIKYLCQFQNEFPKFNPEKLLLFQDEYGQMFLDWMFDHDDESEELAELMEFLNWVKQENVELLENFLNDTNFIKYACYYAEESDLPQFLKSIYNLFESNVSNFKEELFFKRKNEDGETFLNYVSSKVFDFESSSNIITQSGFQILDWIKSISVPIFQELIYESPGIVNNFCLFTPKNYCLKKLKILIEYFEKNVPNFDKVEYLKKQNIEEGKTFLNNFFRNIEKAKISLDIFNWLKSIDIELLKEIILRKSKYGETFLHSLHHFNEELSDLPNILQTIFDYLTKTLSDIDWNQFANEKDVRGKTFLENIDCDFRLPDAEKLPVQIKIIENLRVFGIYLATSIKHVRNAPYRHRSHFSVSTNSATDSWNSDFWIYKNLYGGLVNPCESVAKLQ